ncbi:glycosyltransferase family 2 protein [Flavobacterium sp.]|uniref:glycosyltransferase family 2 protein n=1 Tax=Flavobacterium sp. TaxID=239 RepID=UPI000ECE49C8|nr:glycosyltransferase family 2 protein [Flavobacterium sp.]HCQ11994.1 glycosyl transferase [Flavobacterium sp.]
MSCTFSILLTTKNRLQDLIFTLDKISYLIERQDVECIICDDGSTDGTFDYIKENYPKIIVFRNEISKGLIFSRNLLLGKTTAKYAISLDDDAHFLSDNPLEAIENYFLENSNCGVVSFRIFWGKNNPTSTKTLDNPQRVKGFVGCGHAWKMESWKSIPNYPDWFIFYGEEDFAAYQLFKKNIEIHYLPSVLVHHRVDVLARKNNQDYQLRLRRSFRSGWYLYFMFYPFSVIPKKLLYTLWIQIKTKTFKGDFKATLGIIQALFDVIFNFPKLLKQSNRLTKNEYQALLKLPPTQLYWKPEDEK